ncbi:hypothetical protein F511_25790 [Dorcoceras hygrometricum]|uniref:Uncharacterized protein n=1 Tax=Dorcoceras hygrometricum TaxID=472368 RepID=A0A2Z7C6R5_9LAMI|nr:hypothetical protein F511_25790 [Dorcoceras hygrometricum]
MEPGGDQYDNQNLYVSTYIGCLACYLAGTCAWLQPVFKNPALLGRLRPEQIPAKLAAAAAAHGGGEREREGGAASARYLCDPQWLRDTASRGPTTIVAPESQFRTCPTDHGKCLATSPHDPLGITDSACKNQSVVVSVQYGPFNPYIPIRSTTIGKSRVARDPIAMHTSWRSNSDIASVTSIVLECNNCPCLVERSNRGACVAIRFKKIGVAPLPPAIAFGKAASARSYNWYQSQGHGFDSH